MKLNSTKIEETLQKASDELENSNYHNFVELPQNVWAAITNYIPEEKSVEAARAFSKAIIKLI